MRLNKINIIRRAYLMISVGVQYVFNRIFHVKDVFNRIFHVKDVFNRMFHFTTSLEVLVCFQLDSIIDLYTVLFCNVPYFRNVTSLGFLQSRKIRGK